MKLIKRVASYNFALLFASCAFFTAGYLLITNQKAEAATQSYSETYTVSKWRNCTIGWKYSGVFTGERIAVDQSIGPAQWKITGDIGTTHFEETWDANDWYQTYSHSPYFGVNYRCYNGDFNAGGQTTGYPFPEITVTGMYGMVSQQTKTGGWGTGSSGMLSMPKKWTITGTITTP